MSAAPERTTVMHVEAGEGDAELREEVMSRLEARERARQDEIHQRRQQSAAEANPDEQVDTFLLTYARLRDEAEAALAEAEAGTQATPEAVEAASAAIDRAVALLHDAVHYLPATQLGMAQKGVNALETRRHGLHAKQAQSQTFTFGSRAALEEKRRAKEQRRRERQERKAKKKLKKKKKKKDKDDGKDAPDAGGEEKKGEGEGEGKENDHATAQGECVVTGKEGETLRFDAPLRTLHLVQLRDCEVITETPVSGSVFVRDCHNCTFRLACQQLRLHDSTDDTFLLAIRSNPIIEHCERIGFGPWLEAGADPSDEGLWCKVHDFLWHKKTASPHWYILPDHLPAPPTPE